MGTAQFIIEQHFVPVAIINGLIPFLWNMFTTHQTVRGQQECDFSILGRQRFLVKGVGSFSKGVGAVGHLLVCQKGGFFRKFICEHQQEKRRRGTACSGHTQWWLWLSQDWVFWSQDRVPNCPGHSIGCQKACLIVLQKWNAWSDCCGAACMAWRRRPWSGDWRTVTRSTSISRPVLWTGWILMQVSRNSL